ncbi:hypothetical protein AVEN_249568-1 [Araneus ventricosus]|uniref:Uncharacterized protein n=1 Tax=Araneus ventricosus TaxID=182803 RepID=A0A4Y2KPR8_ARAVE|nr:hypothetical protein AVEN_249568-1 [Araneus ventricosus]
MEDWKQDPVWKAPGMQEYDQISMLPRSCGLFCSPFWVDLKTLRIIRESQTSLRVSLIWASMGSGDPEVPELPSVILASEISQSSTFGVPVFDHRSCLFLHP